MTIEGPAIRRVERLDEGTIGELADVLIDCIDGDAGVSFLHPLEPEKARAFWRDVAAGVEAGDRAVLVAEDDEGILATVQLVLAQPENQPHRADLSKMLVHRRGRRRGPRRRAPRGGRADCARVRQDAPRARHEHR